MNGSESPAAGAPHVLVVAYHYPPAGGVPVRRVLRVLRHLPASGFRCSVLTADHPFDPYHPEDPDGLEGLPPVAHCLRTPARSGIERALSRIWAWRTRAAVGAPSSEAAGAAAPGTGLAGLRRWLQDVWLFPDTKRFWIPGAVREALALHARDPIDVIWATGYPWSSFELAARIASEIARPYALDYRDGWTSNPRRAWDTARQRAREERLAAGAAFVTAATDWIRDELRGRVPGTRIETMTNGYDPSEIPPDTPPAQGTAHCSFTYTGTFNDAWPPTPTDQSPWWLLRAVARLAPAVRADLRIRLIGRMPDAVRRHVVAEGLDDSVEIAGPVSHRAALGAQRAADHLLLIVSDAPGSAGILTGKLVEYAGARRPVLALVPEGEARQAIERAHLGTAIAPRDEAAIADFLEGAVRDWRRSGRPPDTADAPAFLASTQVEGLAALLREASVDGRDGR